MIERRQNENELDFIKRIVNGKLVDKTIDTNYEELSELLFGEGNCYNSSEVRKRMYGMKRIFELMSYDDSKVANRILSISDTHVPFQLPITTFKNYIGVVDTLQLNGDVLDCQSISSFPKTYRVSMLEEMIEARQYIIDLIEYIKPKKVVINYGNHEIRFQNYIAKQIGEDMAQLMPMTALDLICTDGFNFYNKRAKSKQWYEPLKNVFTDIEFEYTENWYCQIGDTIYCHPSAFSSGIMKTAEKAMQWFRNQGFLFRKLVMAHTHRVGSYRIGDTEIFEQGTSSDTKKQNYLDGKLVNSQKEGFIYTCQDKDGNTIDSKTELVCLN